MTFWVITIGCLLLFGAAGYSVYRAFQSPRFIAKLSKIATKAAFKAIKPIVTAPLDLQELAKYQQDYKRGHGDDYWRKRSGAPPKG